MGKHLRTAWEDYELFDSGDGRKLERFGPYVLDRPDPQAIWQPSLSRNDWERADAVYLSGHGGGDWKLNTRLPESWQVRLRKLVFTISLGHFKHVGVFPEQAENWLRLENAITDRTKEQDLRVLNLFGYTGGATLAALGAGASVCHVDSSRPALRMARRNLHASGLEAAAVRWIHEDASRFVEREQRRGNSYHGIIMDPPPYGRGAGGRMWKLEKDLPHLLKLSTMILADTPVFLLLNTYATGYSHFTLRNLLGPVARQHSGNIVSGDLVLPHRSDNRLLPSGIYAFWQAGNPL